MFRAGARLGRYGVNALLQAVLLLLRRRDRGMDAVLIRLILRHDLALSLNRQAERLDGVTRGLALGFPFDRLFSFRLPTVR